MWYNLRNIISDLKFRLVTSAEGRLVALCPRVTHIFISTISGVLRWRSCAPLASETFLSVRKRSDSAAVKWRGLCLCCSAPCWNLSTSESGPTNLSHQSTPNTRTNRWSSKLELHSSPKALINMHPLFSLFAEDVPAFARTLRPAQLGALWARFVIASGARYQLLSGGCSSSCKRVTWQGFHPTSAQ